MARPRVLAALTRRFSDIDLAEEAYQEACLRALERWRRDGLPRDPTGWLLLTGRNATIDRVRRDKRIVFQDVMPEQEEDPGDVEADLADEIDLSELRDDVLRLMFMCCHPDLSLQDQLALALKVIGGFSVEKIARAFVVRPKAMEQRITRAKKKASSLATQLDTPSLQERAARLDAVSTMIYLLFNEGYSASGGDIHIHTELCEEAIRLARLLIALFPSQPEVMGLLSLCLLQHSRRRARIDGKGGLVPLEQQDRSLWSRVEISEGKVLLEKALLRGRPGSYQIQAAIAAVHCAAAGADDTDWQEIERLYAALEQVHPTPVVSLNRAVALAKVRGAAAGLEHLSSLSDALSNYLYFHTTRAALLDEGGETREAIRSYKRALELGPTGQEYEHIREKIALCGQKQKNTDAM
ncbi:RNA polymerase sigma factor [Hoeflea prorocentri]|uniref:RNA polymerase sigma factor n=2 Tax=Hoeflea prorocentri TaxID=1922333 RepID=A0A9X3UGL8_9HYPH|nr:RNA polymerase sigma factor [Hoeflea prorocentri]MCY6380259.1 RNA polymerase sigma factor [Hoeflea prorocentri]MDA5398059.1 RNA polymerase sigma factor [Hoeflea prorocentri]